MKGSVPRALCSHLWGRRPITITHPLQISARRSETPRDLGQLGEVESDKELVLVLVLKTELEERFVFSLPKDQLDREIKEINEVS